MKISIITTCKNRVWNIKDAMQSVLGQTYRNLEYIIVDGASTDGTQKVVLKTLAKFGFEPVKCDCGIQEFADEKGRIVRYVSEDDRGMYDALNTGIRMSSGDVIGMVHSDDMLVDRWVINDYVKKFKTTNADIIYADAFLVSRRNTSKMLRRIVSGPFSRTKFRLGWTPVHCTCMAKREVYGCLGMYNCEYMIAADTDWMIRCMRLPEIKTEYLGLRFVQKMRQGGVCTDLRSSVHLWKEDLKVFQTHGLWPVGLPKLMKVWRKIPHIFAARIRRIYWGGIEFFDILRIAIRMFGWNELLVCLFAAVGVGFGVYETNWHRPLLSLTWAGGVFTICFSMMLLYKIVMGMIENNRSY